MIWLAAILTFCGLGLAAVVTFADGAGVLDELGQTAGDLRDMADSLWLVLIAPVLIYIYRFYVMAKARANAVRVSERQFPKLFTLYQDLGHRLGMDRIPALYVTNGNGVVNAYALECNRRSRYVVIHSEIAMLIDKSPDVVEFVLAHELAHHKLRHVSLWRNVIGIIPNFLVLPGIAATRAQEYSADRVALAVGAGNASAMNLLAVGPWMEKGVDAEAWLEQCTEERREFFVRVANAFSDHAVLVKRFKALRDIEVDGFSRHGDMF